VLLLPAAADDVLLAADLVGVLPVAPGAAAVAVLSALLLPPPHALRTTTEARQSTNAIELLFKVYLRNAPRVCIVRAEGVLGQ